jgi:hypothetical protein
MTTRNLFTGDIRRYEFTVAERVVFPRDPAPPRTADAVRSRPVRDRVYTSYGPYEFGGTVLYLATHPYGRGRWPQDVTNGIRVNELLYISRPPGRTWPQWSGWTFLGTKQYRRHPDDPGVPAAPLPDDELTEHEDAYARWRYASEIKYPGDEVNLIEKMTALGGDGRHYSDFFIKDGDPDVAGPSHPPS